LRGVNLPADARLARCRANAPAAENPL
jgi:hypothetical protein